MSAGYFLLHNHNTHTHTPAHTLTHRQSTHRQQRTRSHRNDFLEAPKSMLELLSLSHTLAHRETAANRLSTVRWRTDSTRKPQSSYFLCLPLFLLRLWSLGLVNILQVLLGLAGNSPSLSLCLYPSLFSLSFLLSLSPALS